MTVQVNSVQMVPDGFGFHIKASEYTWITLVFEPNARPRQPTATPRRLSLRPRR